MSQNFLACDRDRVLLMAPSLRDWLPEDHFAWFLLDAVAAMDLSAFMPPTGGTVTGGRRSIRR